MVTSPDILFFSFKTLKTKKLNLIIMNNLFNLNQKRLVILFFCVFNFSAIFKNFFLYFLIKNLKCKFGFWGCLVIGNRVFREALRTFLSNKLVSEWNQQALNLIFSCIQRNTWFGTNIEKKTVTFLWEQTVSIVYFRTFHIFFLQSKT